MKTRIIAEANTTIIMFLIIMILILVKIITLPVLIPIIKVMKITTAKLHQ